MSAIRPWLAVPGLLVAALLAAVAILVSRNPSSENLAAVYLGGERFMLEIADSPEAITRGLGYRASIPANGGMLFLFDRPDYHTFWMKGMRFPIDIIWLRGDTIVFIQADAPPPSPNRPDEALSRYVPSEPADRVIELRAGTVRSLGLQPGQRARILVP